MHNNIFPHQHRLQSKKKPHPGAVTMETEAVWCSKLFETVKEITGFTPVAEQHLHVGEMQTSETTLGTIPGTRFLLVSSTTLTYGTSVCCCAHSFLLGLLTKRGALRG